MASIGKILKNKREALRYSLTRIHQETRISVAYLEALEEEQFDRIPAEIYLIGFLKKYALYLNLNADFLIDQYRRQKSAGIKIKKIEELYEQKIEKQENSVSVQQAIFLMAVILLGFGLFVSFFIFIKNKNEYVEKKPAIEEKRFLSIPGLHAQKKIPLELSIAAHTKSWIRIESDGDMVFEGILPTKAQKLWKAQDHFTIIAQNWVDIDISLNGRFLSADTLAVNSHRMVIDQEMLKNIVDQNPSSG